MSNQIGHSLKHFLLLMMQNGQKKATRKTDRSGRKIALIYLDEQDRLARGSCAAFDHRSFVMKRSVGNDNAIVPLFIHGRRVLDCLRNAVASCYRPEPWEIRPTLLYSIQSLVGVVAFPLPQKHVTLNDPASFSTSTSIILCADFGNSCVTTNKDRSILSAAKIFSRDSSFWRYKVYMDIRGSPNFYEKFRELPSDLRIT